MAKKGHFFVESTEWHKNRSLWEQCFAGTTTSSDIDRTTKKEQAPALQNACD